MDNQPEEFAGLDDAWRDYRQTLADTISALAPGEFILWELDVPERYEDPTGPYIQVRVDAEGRIYAEVSSNKVLDDRFHLYGPTRRMLRQLGFERPCKEHANYLVRLDAGYADKAADMLVGALRDAFDVVHPAFLIDRVREVIEQTTEPRHLPPVVFHDGRDELQELVDVALGEDIGEDFPQHDGDGDIPYRSGTAVVFVRVLRSSPTVRLFSELVVDIRSLGVAAREVAVLNAEHEFKFVLHKNRVVMYVDLPAWPFVPDHLRITLDRMCELAPQLDAELARKVSGRTFCQPSRGEAA